MKFLVGVMLLASFSAGAAEVISAKLDAGRKNILLDVQYGGGCKEHVFVLEVGQCLESNPVQCTGRLFEKTLGGEDICQAIIKETVVFNLKKMGLKDPYYKNGSLTIYGDRGFTGEATSATIVIP